jgi:hypothetical protein
MGIAIRAADGNVNSWAHSGKPRELREGESYIYDVATIEDAKSEAQKTAEATASAVKAIKVKAGADIIALAPEWKQRNALARMLELVNKKVDGGTLTAEEDAEVAVVESLWATVKAIRAQSDIDEAAV